MKKIWRTVYWKILMSEIIHRDFLFFMYTLFHIDLFYFDIEYKSKSLSISLSESDSKLKSRLIYLAIIHLISFKDDINLLSNVQTCKVCSFFLLSSALPNLIYPVLECFLMCGRPKVVCCVLFHHNFTNNHLSAIKLLDFLSSI